MSESTVETKPVISGIEMSDSSVDPNTKASEETPESVDNSTAGADTEPTEEPTVSTTDDKAVDSTDEKMEVESSDEPRVEAKSADSEPPAPAVDDSEDLAKEVEPAVEPVPEVAVKSPADASGLMSKLSSPAPAVQSSTTPPRSLNSKKPKVDLTTVPVRQYLDTTVVPILLQGLSALARERPAKPINFLANFLLEKSSEYDE